MNIEIGLLPPQAKDLEEAILGAMMLSDKAMEEATQILKPEMFYVNAHKDIFAVIASMSDKNRQVDFNTVTDELRRRKILEEVGGSKMIADLMQNGIMVPRLYEHCLIVKQTWVARKLIEGLTGCVRKAYTEDVADAIEEAQGLLDSLFTEESEARHISEVLDECEIDFHKRIEAARAGLSTGIPTGIADLDRMTGGWQNSNLIVIGGRPGSGKTAVMLHFARIAAEANKPAVVFSLEMSDKGLVNRVVLSKSTIDSNKYRFGRCVTDDDVLDVKRAKELLKHLPIYIDPTPSISIRKIKARAKALKRKGRCSIIMIDYLQLAESMSDKNNRNREQEVSEMSRACKIMAKELDVPVILLAQLSRKCEERTNKRPMLSDLRESGAIEQDADLVMFTFRPEYYGILDVDIEGMNYSTKGYGELIVEKNRDGATGTARFRYNESLTKIYDFEYEGGTQPEERHPDVNKNFEVTRDAPF